MPMRVTVFGASGFLGRYVVERLADRDAVINAAVRRVDAAKFLRPLGDVGQVTPIACPIQDDTAVNAVVDGADTVINLVGTFASSGPQSYKAVHVDGAARIARAAAAHGVKRLLHVSAIGADPRGPSDYARSKAAGEAAVQEAFPAATIIRPSLVFGPEDQFFNLFAGLSRFAPVIPLYGGGHSRFQPVYVCDIASAIASLVYDIDGAGQTVELGGPEVFTFRELIEMVLANVGRRRLLLPVPLALGKLQAFFMELLPNPMITRDQLRQLPVGSVVAPGALGFADLGMTPTALGAILPTYLKRHRPGGRIGRVSVV